MQRGGPHMKPCLGQVSLYTLSAIRKAAVTALLFAAAVFPTKAQDISTLEGRYPELKVRQPGGLTIRVAREDWAAARRLLIQDPEWRKWINSRKDVLDSWISSFNDRAEWIAGHQHELIDPKSQAPVEWSPKMPEPEGGNEQATKFKRGWISYARSYNFDQILEAARM